MDLKYRLRFRRGRVSWKKTRQGSAGLCLAGLRFFILGEADQSVFSGRQGGGGSRIIVVYNGRVKSLGGTMKINLMALSEKRFEELCQSLLLEEYGSSFQAFSPPDQGMDGYDSG